MAIVASDYPGWGEDVASILTVVALMYLAGLLVRLLLHATYSYISQSFGDEPPGWKNPRATQERTSFLFLSNVLLRPTAAAAGAAALLLPLTRLGG